MNPVDLLSNGLLGQFTSLKDLEKQLSQLLSKQCEMLENDFKELNHYQTDEQLAEISLMMKKMNLYRLKLKQLRSDMLYIHSRCTELKRKSLAIQSTKADEHAEKMRCRDYEEGLIAKK